MKFMNLEMKLSNRTETDNQITIDTLNNNILETRIVFLEKEESLLRSEIQNKQDTIQKLLTNNNNLIILCNEKEKKDLSVMKKKTKIFRNEKENKDLSVMKKKTKS